MRFTDRVASLHPAVVSIGFIAIFVGGTMPMIALPLGGADWALVYSITMALLMAPILIWHYSIYRATSDRSASFVGHRGAGRFCSGSAP